MEIQIMISSLRQPDTIGFKVVRSIGTNREFAVWVPIVVAVCMIYPQTDRAVAAVLHQDGPHLLCLSGSRNKARQGGQDDSEEGK